jgi:hypothetical protein
VREIFREELQRRDDELIAGWSEATEILTPFDLRSYIREIVEDVVTEPTEGCCEEGCCDSTPECMWEWPAIWEQAEIDIGLTGLDLVNYIERDLLANFRRVALQYLIASQEETEDAR